MSAQVPKPKPQIRLKGGVWRVMGPQGCRDHETKAKRFVKYLNRVGAVPKKSSRR